MATPDIFRFVSQNSVLSAYKDIGRYHNMKNGQRLGEVRIAEWGDI